MPVRRVINGGGIPQKNAVLNQVYANVLGKPVLVPKGDVTSLGSAIFAFLAAGTFQTIEEAQDALCPDVSTIEPEPDAAADVRGAVSAVPRAVFCASASGGRSRSEIGDDSARAAAHRGGGGARGGQNAGSAAD